MMNSIETICQVERWISIACEEQRGKRQIDGRAVKIEGVTKRQGEADRSLVAAKLLELDEQPRQRAGSEDEVPSTINNSSRGYGAAAGTG